MKLWKNYMVIASIVWPRKLASGNDLQSPLGGTSMHSEVTVVLFQKGDENSGLKQLFEMQKISQIIVISFFNCKGFNLCFYMWLFILFLFIFWKAGQKGGNKRCLIKGISKEQTRSVLSSLGPQHM